MSATKPDAKKPTSKAPPKTREADPFLDTAGDEEKFTAGEERRAMNDALDEFERRLSTGQPAHSPKKRAPATTKPPAHKAAPQKSVAPPPKASHLAPNANNKRRMSSDMKEVEEDLNDEIDEVRRLGEEHDSDSD
ncbi:hypothetical protein ADEAN_000637500 [Angomonas deanei]|uniref:Uncharacterized protein n=1 Tax=Angomonas deanei TaxID=59799 RepID=A0A7G2CKY1_9TRYP|nr:hypothetical protein ADEAN_000637500 [Angomonas deanei]